MNHLDDGDQPGRRRGGTLNLNLDAKNRVHDIKEGNKVGRESEKHKDPTPTPQEGNAPETC